MSEKNHGPVIAIILIIVLLLSAAGGGLYYYLCYIKPFNDIKTAIENEDIDEVVSLYGELRRDDDRIYVQEEMLSYFEKTVKSYKREKIDFDDVEDLYKVLGKKILKKNEEFDDLMDFAENLRDSREYYDTAEELFEAEDYETAIDYYSLVWEEDDNYNDAVLKISECEEIIAELQAQLADGVVGNWMAYINFGGALADFFNSQDSFDFNIGVWLTFNEDGTGSFGVDHQSIIDACSDSSDVLSQYVYDTLADMGYDESLIGVMLSLYGYDSMDTMIAEMITEEIEGELGDESDRVFEYETDGDKVTATGQGMEIEGTLEMQGTAGYALVVGEDADMSFMDDYDIELPVYFYRY